MSGRHRWHPVAEEQLKHIGWHRAESVDAAVIRFATTGRGDVERMSGDRYRLRVGVYQVRLRFDRDANELLVVGVYGPRR